MNTTLQALDRGSVNVEPAPHNNLKERNIRQNVAKAEFTTGAGTKVTIEGTPTEIVELTHLYEARGAPSKPVVRKERGRVSESKSRGVPGYVEELREAGFFVKPKSLAEVIAKLGEAGHTVKAEHLSIVLLRHVRSKKLQRIKDGQKYRYGNR